MDKRFNKKIGMFFLILLALVLPTGVWAGENGGSPDQVLTIQSMDVPAAGYSASSGTIGVRFVPDVPDNIVAGWAFSEDDIYAMCGNGQPRHYDGSAWTKVSTGLGSYVPAVWGSAPDDLYAAGRLDSGGGISHYDGDSWTLVYQGTATLHGIYGTAPDNIYAVGDAGMVVHYDGDSWTEMSVDSTDTWIVVWASPAGKIYVSGYNGEIYRYDGGSWTKTGDTTYVTAIHGTGDDHIYAVDSGSVIRYDGAQWSPVAELAGQGYFQSVWCLGPDDVYVAGTKLIHYNGLTWEPVTTYTSGVTFSHLSPLEEEVLCVGSSPSTMLICGPEDLRVDLAVTKIEVPERVLGGFPQPVSVIVKNTGNLPVTDPFEVSLKYGETALGTQTVSGLPVNETASVSFTFTPDMGDGVLEGFADAGNAVEESDEANNSLVLPFTAGPIENHVTSVSLNRHVLAIGSGGTPATLQASVLPANADVKHVLWSSSDPAVATVDADGLVTTAGPGQAVITVTTVDGGFQDTCVVTVVSCREWSGLTPEGLNGVWGAGSDNIYAVGNNGAILHFDGTDWTPMAGGSSQDLFGVWGTSDGSLVYAVGSGGTVLKYEGAQWTPVETSTDDDLRYVWCDDAGNIFIAGGSTVLDYHGGNWNVQTVSPDALGILGLWASSAANVYVTYNHSSGGGDVGTSRTPCTLHYTGAGWETINLGSSNSYTLQDGLWGCAPDEIYMPSVGIRVFNGTELSEAYASMTGSPLKFWVPESGKLYHLNKSTYVGDPYRQHMISLMGEDKQDVVLYQAGAKLNGLWGLSVNEVYAVGENGTVVRYFNEEASEAKLNIVKQGAGSVTTASGVTRFTPGAEAVLTAIGAKDSAFASWGGDLSGTDNPLTLVMDGDKTVEASFGGAPDLTIAGIVLPDGLYKGTPANIRITVENIGTGDAGRFTVGLTGDGYLIGMAAVDSLEAGASSEVTVSWTPNRTGGFLLDAKADGEETVPETNESNNRLTVTAQVQGTAAPETLVAVEPAEKEVNVGDTFTLDVTVDPAQAIAGAQFELSFDPAVVHVTGTAEGNLLKQGGWSTFHFPGNIDNTAGTLTGVAGAIISPGGSVSTKGVFASVAFEAVGPGRTSLTLSKVKVPDMASDLVPVSVTGGGVTVRGEDDGKISVTLRVEGPDYTILPETEVRVEDGADNIAVLQAAGLTVGESGGFVNTIEGIRGNPWWGFNPWIPSFKEGDSVVYAGNGAIDVARIEAPDQGEAGSAFPVTVTGGSGEGVANARILYYQEGQHRSPVKTEIYTGADGQVQVTIAEPGVYYLAGEGSDIVRTKARAITVTEGEEPGVTLVKVGTVSGQPGQEVTVPVDIENVTGLAGGQFTLTFDPGVAVPTQVESGDFLTGFSFERNLSVNGKVYAAFAKDEGVNGSGELARITFRIQEDPQGESSPVQIAGLKLNDEESKTIPAEEENGEIKVTGSGVLYGDVNGDGDVTAGDATLVLQDVVELITLTPDQITAGDVNGDGEITAGDAILILRYVVELIDHFPVEVK